MPASFQWIDLFGIAGAVIFYSRFYLQWYFSERAGRSVVPVGFWYLSAAGSISLFLYGVLLQSPLGVFAHCFNMVVYARNLVHIWRRRDTLTAWRMRFANAAIVLSLGAAVVLLAYTWFGHYQTSKEAQPSEALWGWFLIALGLLGQVLFASRFLLQWLVTEARKKSTFPTAFWYVSIAASLLQILSFGGQGEWVFALGLVSTMPVYLRNLWLIHRRPGAAPPVES
jgi:4-amino-4-deoxy-L-arabinose transferase